MFSQLRVAYHKTPAKAVPSVASRLPLGKEEWEPSDFNGRVCLPGCQSVGVGGGGRGVEDLVESRMQLFALISCFHCGRLEWQWRQLEEERVTLAPSSHTNTQINQRSLALALHSSSPLRHVHQQVFSPPLLHIHCTKSSAGACRRGAAAGRRQLIFMLM